MTGTSIETRVIDGRRVAEGLRETVASRVADYKEQHGRPPALTTILVGNDPASNVYVNNKHKACAEVGIDSSDERLPADTSPEYLTGLIDELNRRDDVDGILLQLPLPSGLDDDALSGLIDPRKDVDGLTTLNAGRVVQGREALVPCTPSGVMILLEQAGATLSGAEAVVVGRSNLVGRPVASLLLAQDATVTTCHSRTRNLAEVTRRADVLIACVGAPNLIDGSMVKPGAIVIDVGTSRTEHGLVGDVDFDSVIGVAGAVTPVPGGVGPMTIACLLENTLKAAEARVSS
ncbi:MAG: bifunctional methylenetetrahydrofolate dehydrogenase/methenyltetrahydrofolate cyclohydrolase FolD [Thermoleophilaceae bacterium]|nr:bifunctional methylenetetrahydrofolate dehydrogenase/methenyltetrahydrofolate cyclohydrolase FolD [Thermoleophilaceae bacterium]